MPNFMSGLEVAAKGDIISMLSQVEVVTFSAVATEYPKRGGTILENWVRKPGAPEHVPETIEFKVNKKQQDLGELSEDKLRIRFKLKLRERFAKISTSDTALSVLLIENAAKKFKIDEDLTPRQKLNFVCQRYLRELLEKTRKQYKGMSPDKRRKVDEILNRNIESMSAEDRAKLKAALKVDSLSAESLKAVMLGASPAAALAVLQMTGFGAYLALTTIMHAVFTTMLGVTLPFAAYTGATSVLSIFLGPLGIGLSLLTMGIGSFWVKSTIDREISAFIVFSLGSALSGTYNAKPTDMPSGRLLDRATEIDSDMEAVYRELQAEKENHQQAESRRRQAQSDALRATQREQAKERDLWEQYACVKSLELRLQGAVQSRDIGEAELATEKAKSEELKRCLRAAEIDKQQAVASAEKYLASALQADERLKRSQAREEQWIAKKRTELLSSYSVHYPRFTFDPGPLRWLAKQVIKGRIEAESALKELHDSLDAAALGTKKLHSIKNLFEMKFKIRDRTPGRICYSPQNGGSVRIVLICEREDLTEELAKVR